MPENFFIKPANTPFGANKSKCIKVYAKSNEGLPVNIDHEKRYGTYDAGIEPFLDRIHNFEVRKDDIWVITMPKCGTTWMLELVWLLQHDLDYETALNVNQEERSPFLEICGLFSTVIPNSLDIIEHLQSPRIIKSHLAMHMLPKGLWTVKPKIIYVAREPKDAAISYYYFMTGLGKNHTTKEEFMNNVLNNEMNFYPFWNHVVEFWKLRKEPYVYFTSFERMKNDLSAVIRQISGFLQKPISDVQMEELQQHLSFEQMKKNPMCNHVKEIQNAQSIFGAKNNNFSFIRKGEIGSHKEDLSKEIINKFDTWTLNELKQFGVSSKEILYS